MRRQRPDKYILRGKIALPCDDLLEWARFMEDRTKNIVAQTDIDEEELSVSTVFIGLDHSFAWNESLDQVPPILFETIAFGERKTFEFAGRIRTYREVLGEWRYSTWAEAEEGHQGVVEEMRRRFAEAGKIALIKRPEEGKT